MSAKAEITITILLEPDCADGPGISSDAEIVYDDTFYVTSGSVDDVMSAAEDALVKAKEACFHRSWYGIPA